MKSYIVDANLIVLLVVGSYDIGLVSERRHKRCREFDAQDFETLDNLLRPATRVMSTPHAMAEASNLVRAIGEPLKSILTAHLGLLTPGFIEVYTPSADAAADIAFPRLGLTDASMLTVGDDLEILTTDLDLYIAATGRGRNATNFAHLRGR